MALSEAEGLLRIAAVDLESAQASSDPVVFREGAWGFWLQQAVEKALKAWLLHLGADPPLTHDLLRLLLLLEAQGVKTKPPQPLGQLTVYAVQFRYDADPTPPAPPPSPWWANGPGGGVWRRGEQPSRHSP